MTTLGPALRALASALWSVVRVLAARVAPGLSPFRSPDRCGTVRSTGGGWDVSGRRRARPAALAGAKTVSLESRWPPNAGTATPHAHYPLHTQAGHGGGCRVPFPRARNGGPGRQRSRHSGTADARHSPRGTTADSAMPAPARWSAHRIVRLGNPERPGSSRTGPETGTSCRSTLATNNTPGRGPEASGRFPSP